MKSHPVLMVMVLVLMVTAGAAESSAAPDPGEYANFFIDDSGVVRVPRHYSTIQTAIDAVPSNTRILVDPGIYFEDLVIDSKSIAVEAQFGPEQTIISGSGGAPLVRVYDTPQRSALRGFTLRDGAASAGGAIQINNSEFNLIGNRIIDHNLSDDAAAIFYYMSDGLIAFNRITDPRGHAIKARGGDIDVYGNLISNTGGAGIMLEEPVVYSILHNRLESCDGYGIFVDEAGSGPSSIAGNVVMRSGLAGLRLIGGQTQVTNNLFADSDSYGVQLGGDLGASILNNTITGSRLSGVQILAGDLTFDYNILVSNGRYGIITSEGAAVDADYNLLHQNSSGPYGGSIEPGANDILDDPLFTGGPLGSHYLSQQEAGQPDDSPALDAGDVPAGDILIADDPDLRWDRFFVDDSGVYRGGQSLDQMTSRTDEGWDSGQIDIGFHYPPTGYPNLAVELYMRDVDLQPGDVFDLRMITYNDPFPFPADHYVVLDVFGQYFFWPSWSNYPESLDFVTDMLHPNAHGRYILQFIWPDFFLSAQGVKFWAVAILHGGGDDLVSEIAQIEWSFSGG